MKYFVKDFLRGIGITFAILCYIAMAACFVLAAIGVLMVLAGEITWKIPLALAVGGIPPGATAYAVGQAL